MAQIWQLLWLWYGLAAAAAIRPLAWELPHTTRAALKRKKKIDIHFFLKENQILSSQKSNKCLRHRLLEFSYKAMFPYCEHLKNRGGALVIFVFGEPMTGFTHSDASHQMHILLLNCNLE